MVAADLAENTAGLEKALQVDQASVPPKLAKIIAEINTSLDANLTSSSAPKPVRDPKTADQQLHMQQLTKLPTADSSGSADNVEGEAETDYLFTPSPDTYTHLLIRRDIPKEDVSSSLFLLSSCIANQPYVTEDLIARYFRGSIVPSADVFLASNTLPDLAIQEGSFKWAPSHKIILVERNRLQPTAACVWAVRQSLVSAISEYSDLTHLKEQPILVYDWRILEDIQTMEKQKVTDAAEIDRRLAKYFLCFIAWDWMNREVAAEGEKEPVWQGGVVIGKSERELGLWDEKRKKCGPGGCVHEVE